MSSSALTTPTFQAKIGSIQNQADTSAVYNGGIWSFKDATAVTRFYIGNDGKVGVGTTTPNTKLEVAGGLFVSGSGAADLPAQTAGGLRFSYEYPTNRIYFSDGTGYKVSFAKRMSSTTTDLFHVLDNGTVQTVSLPTVSSGANALTGAFNVNEVTLTDGHYGTALHWQSLIPGGYRQHASLGSWRSGAWGSVFLGVGGNDNSLTAFWTFSHGGTTFNPLNSTAWSTTSDERIKQNIRPVNECLNKIVSLNPVHFEYIHKPEQIKTGFIAQQFEQVLPGHVMETGCHEDIVKIKPELKDAKIKAIDADLIPYLVGAIKELSAKVDAQAAEIEALKAK